MNPVQRKLQIPENALVLLLNVPLPVENIFGGIPEFRMADANETGIEAAILFVKSKAEITEMVPLVLNALAFEGLLWIAYPKKSSGFNTDISRDFGWEALLTRDWGPVRQVAIDDTWSALRWRPEKDIKRKPDSVFHKKKGM